MTNNKDDNSFHFGTIKVIFSIIMSIALALGIINGIKKFEARNVIEEKSKEDFILEMRRLGINSIGFVTNKKRYYGTKTGRYYWAEIDRIYINNQRVNKELELFDEDFITCNDSICYVLFYRTTNNFGDSILLKFYPKFKYERYDLDNNIMEKQNVIPGAFIDKKFRIKHFDKTFKKRVNVTF